ncbi:MAG TPA: extracellular solute-binding protein [Caldimonas sp.]|nr:extracellular solute-binding protein [Caldimonas sp.]
MKSAVAVHAAGSLRGAFNAVGAAFVAAHPGQAVRLDFGPSGLIKDRLLASPGGGVFASANMEHPEALARAGRAGAVRPFARNALCAVVRAGVDATTATLVERMLDPAIKLGTSTPKADPSGDYAWQLFDRVERSGVAGARAWLEAKALQLVGGSTAPPPESRLGTAYARLLGSGQADIVLTYRTNATQALRESPSLRVVDVPRAIEVEVQYGVTVLAGSDDSAQAFVDFLLGERARALLAAEGFGEP